MTEHSLVRLQDAEGTSALVAPHLGGWLLRYTRSFAEHGEVDALHFDPAVLGRYPREMYAGSPVLFPLVSYNHVGDQDHHYEWNQRLFEMAQHGFARRSPWRVTDQTDLAVTMELTETAVTQAQYPFRFRCQLTYRLAGGRLQGAQEIENRSDEPMPFASGFHPYIPVPLTQRGERRECFVQIPEGRRCTLHGRAEHVTAKPFPAQAWSVAEDVSDTLFLADLHPRELLLVDPLSELEVAVNWEEAPDHRFAAIWSRSTEEPFYCLEPWTALPNAFTRARDHELIVLPPGERRSAAFWLELRALE